MTPKQRYQFDLQKDDFSYDPAQERAVEMLDLLYQALLQEPEKPKKGLLSSLAGVFAKPEVKKPVKGLYFWGGVGRGKTYLMDAFYDSLPFDRKLRAHFHRFMQRVHKELKNLAGEKDPLKAVAANIARDARVICFDEFFVTDITDAMILAGLFEELFGHGVTLVATSNIVPDQLYKDGLQRSRFIPAIDMIKEHTVVVNVDGGIDYRLRALEQAELYHYPLDDEADTSLMRSFMSLSPDDQHIEEQLQLEVEGRLIQSQRISDDIAWFDFKALCDGPRSQNDYIELARIFHAVLISNVPQMSRPMDDQARRFINMIDEFYDRNVKVVISAAVALNELYDGGKLDFEFQRTQSRLLEMQSHDYLAREHRP